MGSDLWGEATARAYDATSAAMFDPAVLDPAVDVLADLAGDGPALELAIGTGRVALPLSGRGVPVQGIELSPHMAAQLRAKPGAEAVPVTVGNMATTSVPGAFSLVYVVWNSLLNVTTQDEQVAVFENAAAHLAPGGCFVLELVVPKPHLFTPGDPPTRVFSFEPDHLGLDTLDDPVGQVSRSHHWFTVDGKQRHWVGSFRYVWPSELDLMARVAGLRLRHRWSDWHRAPFTAESESQVVVYEKPS